VKTTDFFRVHHENPPIVLAQNPIEFFCSGVPRPVSYPNSRLIRRLLKRVAGPGNSRPFLSLKMSIFLNGGMHLLHRGALR
jgi:hypothetical protein